MEIKKISMHSFNMMVRTIGKISLWFFVITQGFVLLFLFVNPPITFLMVQKIIHNKSVPFSPVKKKWVDLKNISNNLKLATIIAEDRLFLAHRGFDIQSIYYAYKSNKTGKKITGGSTISQQTAKNVFLWPDRSWMRKGLETYFTFMIEMFWSKERILEVYLNVIEMGDGIYGAEAASQYYFNKSCGKLTPTEAALLVSCFPNPLKWTPNKTNKYILGRQSKIINLMKVVRLNL